MFCQLDNTEQKYRYFIIWIRISPLKNSHSVSYVNKLFAFHVIFLFFIGNYIHIYALNKIFHMFKCSKFTYKLNIFYVKCVLIPYEKKKESHANILISVCLLQELVVIAVVRIVKEDVCHVTFNLVQHCALLIRRLYWLHLIAYHQKQIRGKYSMHFIQHACI